jgi:long-subunit acyl-CoA synthetase (AMP-forming)
MPHDVGMLRERLQEQARRCTGQPVLRGANASFSYTQLLAELELRQTWLRRQPAGTLGLLLDNGPELLLWDLAALLDERPCVIVPPFFSSTQRCHCLRQTQASVLLAEECFAQELQRAGYARNGPGWRRPVSQAAPLPVGTAKITYTSGSSGTAKGVCLAARSLLQVAAALAAASAEATPRNYLVVLPLGVLLENLGVYAALMAGVCVSLYPAQQIGMGGATQVDWPRFLGAILSSGADSMILVPQLLLGLLCAIEQGHFKAASLRFVAVGGARVASSLLHRAEAVGLPVFEGYGLSECASVVCLNRPGARRIGSVGRPLPHLQVRIAADGEILVRGARLLGYLGEPAVQEDWWPTGDLGRLDDSGFVHVVGRKKNQFITSFGRNVNPEWIEAELTQNGVLAQAFVHGEGLPRNFALLWPHRGTLSDAAIERLIQHCNAGLPDYAQVHAWRRLPEPFSMTTGTLTHNARLRRQEILRRYAGLIRTLRPGVSA